MLYEVITAGRELYARLDAPGRVFALLAEGELHLFRGDLGHSGFGQRNNFV